MNDIKVMNHAADNIRILAASMVEKANSGHPGGAMGGSDFINVLFSEYLVYDPADPTWTGRDRFFLDPGHMSPMLYAGLALRGFFSMEDLKQFRQWGSVTPGHPELDLHRAAAAHRLGAVLQCLGFAGHRLRDVVAQQLLHPLRRRMAQNQNGHMDTPGPQLHGLVQTGHRQIVRPQLLQHSGHLHRPVAIGVRVRYAL